MKLAIKIVIGTIIIALVVAVIMLYFLPTPTSWQGGWILFHVPLAITSAYACLHIAAALLFLIGVKVYKSQLRHAYTLIASSILLFALGTIQIPIVAGLDLWQSMWVTSGIIGLPFLFAGLTSYFGSRNLARLVGVKTIFTRAMIVIPAVIAIMALSMLLVLKTQRLGEVA